MNQTQRVTNEILGELQAVASRIVVSGAARRGEEIDGRVTLVATSRSWGEVTPLAPSFIDLSPIRAMLYQWEEEGTLIIDWAVPFPKRDWYGPGYATGVHTATDTTVEIIETETRKWGLALLLSTGPADFRDELTNRLSWIQGLLRPFFIEHGMIKQPLQRRSGVVAIDTPTEEDVFDVLGLPFCPPEERSREWVREHWPYQEIFQAPQPIRRGVSHDWT